MGRPLSRIIPAGLVLVCALTACGRRPAAHQAPAARPWILLVTLDTTRADAIGPDAPGVDTPAFTTVADRGLRFRQAYATVPETLPSHASMLTGLYPGGHGLHENGRTLAASTPLAAERLKAAGYRTAAVVSSFALAHRFGLARGFDVYDDDLPAGTSERTAAETTRAALAHVAPGSAPLFLWVHYYDPHAPYTPPEPFATRYRKHPYLGEIAFVDEQLGALGAGFEKAAPGPVAIVIAGDHGEGLGEHGEALHGNLLYQATVHVPLVVAGPGIAPAVRDTPVSTRRVYDTILSLAGLGDGRDLQEPLDEPVLGEAMKPFLEYGWQPQVMAVDGTRKAIVAGRVEMYDLAADPGEMHDLGAGANMRAAARQALDDYPIPSPEAARPPAILDDEARQRLASLGYVSAGAAPVVRQDAPRPADMTRLFPIIDAASGLFVASRYREAIPLFEQIAGADPGNLDAWLRLAASHSALGQDAAAEAAFANAEALAPHSPDVRLYRALHDARGNDWQRAVPVLEELVEAMPDRVPGLEALAAMRERQGRPRDALALRQRVYALRQPDAPELVHLGELAMEARDTAAAIDAFERARAAQGAAFRHDLELGVLYLDARRLEDARAALDRVPRSSPGYPMALFKRAQVSVLLAEPDRAARIDAARQAADATTKPLIARERLFAEVR
jgi:arylsulfatase A-like enzyme/Tfp pilus assembly protein PilF